MSSSIFLPCAALNIVKTTSEDQRTKNNNKSSLEKIETREWQEWPQHLKAKVLSNGLRHIGYYSIRLSLSHFLDFKIWKNMYLTSNIYNKQRNSVSTSWHTTTCYSNCNISQPWDLTYVNNITVIISQSM